MTHKFEIKVDQSMLRDAWQAWVFRRERLWKFLIAAAFMLVSVYLDFRSDGLGTGSVLLLALLGIAVLFFASIYFVGLRRAVSKLQWIAEGKATYRLTDQTIEAQSSLGSIALSWESVTELRKYKNLVLISFQGSSYSTIPLAQIQEAALSFMIVKSKDAGAKIRNL